MFESTTTAGGKTHFRSSLLHRLGVRHAFTSRHWDVKSLDDVRGVASDLGWSSRGGVADIVISRQVHGGDVSRPGARLACADGHVTDRPGEVLAIRTADCVPVLLATQDGRVVAAVHAGWRGLTPQTAVIGRAVTAVRQLAGPAAVLTAAIGPCISGRRYEVGPEVAELFQPGYPQAITTPPAGRPFLDVRAVAAAQLLEAGVDPAQLDVSPACTFDDLDHAFSFRREGKGVGHLAALITPRQP